MERIARFDVNTGTTLERAAQTVAGEAGWHMDGHGAIYCDEKAYIGASLTEVAEAMKDLRLVNDYGGVIWSRIEELTSEDGTDGGWQRSTWLPYSPRHVPGLLGLYIAQAVGDRRRRGVTA